MKKLPLFLFASAMTLVGCMNHDDATSVNIPLDKNAINENAKNIFGEIDPNQDWSSTTQGQVTIKADANLEDIEKIQILTESPFLNDNVKVLNEVAVKNGQTVTLSYEAPNVYDQLVAACVSKSGVYYIQAFDKDQKEVSFASTAQARMTRAIANEAPTLTTLKLKSHASLLLSHLSSAQMMVFHSISIQRQSYSHHQQCSQLQAQQLASDTKKSRLKNSRLTKQLFSAREQARAALERSQRSTKNLLTSLSRKEISQSSVT